MTKLRISKDLALPIEAVTQTFALLGKRGSGKTNTAVVMVEQMVRAGLPVVVVDPVGVWWGLRFGADGKSPGLPVLILGGEHGDVPLEEGAGAIIADFVIESQRPAVLDLGLFTKSAARRFMLAFCDRLYHAKATRKEALHVVLDEADSFIPQRIEHGGEQLVGAINDIVRRGRARGLGVTLISQRPALINKDVLTQIEVLVALRLTGPHDRDAIERWVEDNADQVAAKQVLASLPTLDIGEAWVWSPGWLDLFKRVHIDARTTFDSSATPKAGAKVVAPKNAAAVDLETLRVKIADTIERAKADDPKELRAQIAALKKELAAKPVAPAKVERVEVPVLTKEHLEAIQRAADQASAAARALEKATEGVRSATWMREGPLVKDWERDGSDTAPRRNVVTNGSSHSAEPKPRLVSPPRQVTKPSTASASKLGAGERTILTAIAQHGDGVTREQLSVLTGYKRSSRDTYLQRLRAAELVEQRGEILTATSAGVRELGSGFEPLPTGEALRDHWLEKLPEGERKILALVCEEYPKTVDRETLSEMTDYKRSSRDTYLQRLGARRLVENVGRGEVRASETLFS